MINKELQEKIDGIENVLKKFWIDGRHKNIIHENLVWIEGWIAWADAFINGLADKLKNSRKIN